MLPQHCLTCFEDFEKEAEKKLTKNAWSYYSSGTRQKQTMLNNIAAYNRYLIRPHVLRNVSNIDISTTVLGKKISIPVGVAPTGMHCLANPDGEIATARACQRMDTCMILSAWSTKTMEDIANNVAVKWFQIQPYTNTESLVKRAESAGYDAIVLTVDDPVMQLPAMEPGFDLPQQFSIANFDITEEQRKSLGTIKSCDLFCTTTASADWTFVDWLSSITTLPIVLKGILRPEDAKEASKHNVKGIIVSNHGGRKLDTAPATIDALPGIVHAVEGSGVEVYIDGGIRHGTDVLKALALGARAVFVGRPALYGLACNGEDGVYQIMNILKHETTRAVAMSGCTSVDEVQTTKDLVVRGSFYN